MTLVQYAQYPDRMFQRAEGRAVVSGRTACLFIGASSVLFTASAAHAAGFASAEFAGESGTVVSPNPAGLYFNPAAIAFVPGVDVFAGGVLALRSGSWSHFRSSGEVPDPAGAEGANVGTAHFTNVFGAPAIAATTRVGDFAFGAGAYVPFGGRMKWSPSEHFLTDPNYPLAAGGVQRWTLTEGALTHLYSTLGAAVRWDHLAIGLTGNLIYSSITTMQAKSYSATGLPDTTSEGRDRVDVSGWDGSFGLGAMFEAIPDELWFGASYQSRPNIGGEMKLKGTLTLGYQGEAAPQPITFIHALPDILRFGVRYKYSQTLELRLFGDYTRWSVLQGQCISTRDKPCAVSTSGTDITPELTTIQYMARKWNDTFAVRLGLTYELTPDVGLVWGAGYESAATPDTTLDPAMPDAPSVRLALGARVALTHTLTGTLGITGVYSFERDNTGKSTLATYDLPARRADGGGIYDLWLAMLSLGLEMHL